MIYIYIYIYIPLSRVKNCLYLLLKATHGLPTVRRDYYAAKPIRSAVYCLNERANHFTIQIHWSKEAPLHISLIKNFTLLIWSQSDHSKGSCNKRVKHFTKRRDCKKATQFGFLVTKLECDDIPSTQCRIFVKSEIAHRQHTFTSSPMVWMGFITRSYHPWMCL